ncbi:MAG: cytochrome c maturation protein CcmE [Bradymonadia bacterium]
MAEESTNKGGNIRMVVGLLLLVGVFYMMVGSMVGDGNAYFLTVDEAVAQSDSLVDKPVRIKGKIVKGTWRHKDGTKDHVFMIQEKGKQMQVKYTGPMPDTFEMAAEQEGEVVAEGKFLAGNTLMATEVVAKCPSKYEGSDVPEEMKKAMTQGS